MISKTLSTSEKRAALHGTVPELAEFCQQLYPLLVAHSDDFGRLQGDTFTVKHAIDPTSPRPLPDFARALQALNDVHLIAWYQVSDRHFIQIENFDPHQTGLHKRTSSSFPVPPGGSGSFREDQPPVPPVPFELKGTEPKGTEGKRTSTQAALAALRKGFDLWFAEYPKQEDEEGAWSQWKRLKPNEGLQAEMVAAIRVQRTREDWLKEAGQYVPMAKNWLRGKRWKDRNGRSSPTAREPYHWKACTHTPKCGSSRECNVRKATKKVAS